MKNFLILFLFMITVFSKVAFCKTEKCSLNGQWFSLNGIPVYRLKENGSKVSLEENVIHPTCGELTINGITDGHYFDFKFSMSNTEEAYCRTWIKIIGTFTSADCAQIQGKMITHMEIQDSASYNATTLFSWYKNVIKIINPEPNTTLVITAKPEMPPFNAVARIEKPGGIEYIIHHLIMNYNTAPYTWNLKLQHTPIPKLKFNVILDEVQTNDPAFTPNFNLLKNADKQEAPLIGGVMGGELTLSVDYYKSVHDEKNTL